MTITLAEAAAQVERTGKPLRIGSPGNVRAVMVTAAEYDRLLAVAGNPDAEVHRLTPVARTADPETSHTAARQVRGARRTRKLSVLAVLEEAGTWVDGWRLTTPDVGGSEGLRRLRELEADGILVEKRPHPDPALSTWQYRLVQPGEQAAHLSR
jgi:hypothetical protein